ncbi:MAG TPA: NAD(P)-dependent oxidoreductase [Polyangiaceae bacterium]|nr:NAD(P)-dependent oxidoreductase [Polyangiaceae bacterium]
MLTTTLDVFILGATGFVGGATLDAALSAGLSVGAWARSDAQAELLRRRGVVVTAPPQIPAARVVIDLVQPKLPARLTESALAEAARYRVEMTRGALSALPADALLFSVSGTDDFEPGIISHRSPFTSHPAGFARIGLSVRAEVLASKRPFASLHLGTVYGPGKAFAATLFPRLAKGKLPIVGNGSNRMPLVHVEDAARALVHLTTLSRETLTAHPWIISDGADTTQRELLELGAQLLGARPPKSVPRWLASLFAGSVAASSFARDLPTDPSALVATGFTFKYSSIATGLPYSLARLGAA